MIEKSGNGWRVSGPMLIAGAVSLLDSGRSFLSSANSADGVVFDLSAVEETDSSALGVIFGWLRTAQAGGVKMHIANPPASMLSLAALYGVSDSLPLA
ncbi:MAG: STAS domain-containing protein [Propionivibrio sp.]